MIFGAIVHLNGLGKIEGITGKSLHGRTFFSFEGIPYGAAPINQNRFAVSLPHDIHHCHEIPKFRNLSQSCLGKELIKLIPK